MLDLRSIVYSSARGLFGIECPGVYAGGLTGVPAAGGALVSDQSEFTSNAARSSTCMVSAVQNGSP